LKRPRIGFIYGESESNRPARNNKLNVENQTITDYTPKENKRILALHPSKQRNVNRNYTGYIKRFKEETCEV